MKLKSYAKVNLFLKVFKKTNKLHPVVSLVAKVNLFDLIDIKVTNKHNKVIVKTKNIFIPHEKNIVFKTINILKDRFKIKQGVEVIITKKIPLQAGLGGGSSNAAVVLQYLIKKLSIKISKKDLNELALSIGSDVAAFLTNQPVLVEGFGEKTKVVNVKLPKYIVLAKPKMGISTIDAYKLLDESENKQLSIGGIKILENIKQGKYFIFNDLEKPLLKKYKFLSNLYKEMIKLSFDFVLVSGSGSTIFGLTNNYEIAEKATKKLPKNLEIVGIYKFL